MIDTSHPAFWQLLLLIAGSTFGILAEAQRRKTRELEAKLKEIEFAHEEKRDDSTRENSFVAALLSLSDALRQQSKETNDSITKLSEAMIARADATDREREAWRDTMNTSTMVQTSHVAEIRRLATAGEHQVTLLQEAARVLKTINGQTGDLTKARKQDAEKHDSSIQIMSETLETITDILLSLYDTVTARPETALEVQQQINTALAELVLLKEAIARIEERLSAPPVKLPESSGQE